MTATSGSTKLLISQRHGPGICLALALAYDTAVPDNLPSTDDSIGWEAVFYAALSATRWSCDDYFFPYERRRFPHWQA